MTRLSFLSARALPCLSYATVAAVAYGLALCPPSEIIRRFCHSLRQRRRPRLSSLELASHQLHDEQLSALAGTAYVPPLPEPVVQVLSRCCLCFLATTSEDSPHLSLMRFSFSPALDDSGAELLIVSTRRATKKYVLLCANRRVALLVHDFVGMGEHDTVNYTRVDGRARHSITLNGDVKEQKGEMAERYRAIHLSRNEAYKQFIVGADIAILTVEITEARVCDVNDSVRHFAREGGQANPTLWKEVAG